MINMGKPVWGVMAVISAIVFIALHFSNSSKDLDPFEPTLVDVDTQVTPEIVSSLDDTDIFVLHGTLSVIDTAGREIVVKSGSLEWRYSNTVRFEKVAINNGEWEIVSESPFPARGALEFREVVVDSKFVLLEREYLLIPDSLEVHLKGQLQKAPILSVVDKTTGQDVGSMTVIATKDNNVLGCNGGLANFDLGYDFHNAKLVAENVPSPLVLPYLGEKYDHLAVFPVGYEPAEVNYFENKSAKLSVEPSVTMEVVIDGFDSDLQMLLKDGDSKDNFVVTVSDVEREGVFSKNISELTLSEYSSELLEKYFNPWEVGSHFYSEEGLQYSYNARVHAWGRSEGNIAKSEIRCRISLGDDGIASLRIPNGEYVVSVGEYDKYVQINKGTFHRILIDKEELLKAQEKIEVSGTLLLGESFTSPSSILFWPPIAQNDIYHRNAELKKTDVAGVYQWDAGKLLPGQYRFSISFEAGGNIVNAETYVDVEGVGKQEINLTLQDPAAEFYSEFEGFDGAEFRPLNDYFTYFQYVGDFLIMGVVRKNELGQYEGKAYPGKFWARWYSSTHQIVEISDTGEINSAQYARFTLDRGLNKVDLYGRQQGFLRLTLVDLGGESIWKKYQQQGKLKFKVQRLLADGTLESESADNNYLSDDRIEFAFKDPGFYRITMPPKLGNTPSVEVEILAGETIDRQIIVE